MQKAFIKLHYQIVRINDSLEITDLIEILFAHQFVKPGPAGYSVDIGKTDTVEFQLKNSSSDDQSLLGKADLPEFLMEALLRGLVTGLDSTAALHTGAVIHENRAIFIAGISGSGKSVLTTWLVQNGSNRRACRFAARRSFRQCAFFQSIGHSSRCYPRNRWQCL
jgi:hypothetical protein